MFHTLEELNAWLGQRCRACALERAATPPSATGLRWRTFWSWSGSKWMPIAFDGYVEHTVRVSSTCLICVARNRDSVPCERVGQWVSSRLYPSRIRVIADDTMIASHECLFD